MVWPKPLRRSLVVLAGVVPILAVASTAGASGLTRISTDTFTDPGAQHQTEVEPHALAWGNTIVAAFQVGRFFSGGSDDIGFATSTDGGGSWTHGVLPGVTKAVGGPWDRASDPAVAYDASHGVWLVSYLGMNAGSTSFPKPQRIDIVVSRSSDGLDWSDPIIIKRGGHLDKNWTTCDNTSTSSFYGHCYTEFDNFYQFDRVYMTTSTDGGQTWSGPKPTADAVNGFGGQPVVQPDGTVVVPFLGIGTPKNFGFAIDSFVSTDGGDSWSDSVVVAATQHQFPAGGLREIEFPSVGFDADGTVYVVWSDCRFETDCAANDLVMSTSGDGLSWTSVARIPIDAVGSGVDHFLPGLGVDRSTSGSSAKLGLVYYSYPEADCTTCHLDVGFVSSTNGGSTWSSSTQLAGPMDLSWLPITTSGLMVGDYFATAIVPGSGVGYPVFAVAAAPSGDLLDEAMYTFGQTLTGGILRARSDGARSVAPQSRRVTLPITW